MNKSETYSPAEEASPCHSGRFDNMSVRIPLTGDPQGRYAPLLCDVVHIILCGQNKGIGHGVLEWDTKRHKTDGIKSFVLLWAFAWEFCNMIPENHQKTC